jgi:hypothetical protein
MSRVSITVVLRTLISNQAAGVAIFGGVIDPALVRSRNGETNIVYVGPENLSSLDQDLSPSTIQADDASGVAIAVTESLRLGYRWIGCAWTSRQAMTSARSPENWSRMGASWCSALTIRLMLRSTTAPRAGSRS